MGDHTCDTNGTAIADMVRDKTGRVRIVISKTCSKCGLITEVK